MDSEKLIPGTIHKPWGHERITVQNDLYVVKELYIKAGHRLSLQYHNKKIETLFLVNGDGYISLNEGGKLTFHRPHNLVPVFVGQKKVHRIGAGAKNALFVEVSSTELDDIVRIEDDYGR